MFRNFSKKIKGEVLISRFGSKQPLRQQSTYAYFIDQHVLILLELCVVWCYSVKCPFSVCSVIFLFSCLAVSNCIGNMFDFPEILHVARSVLDQSDCRTFQTTQETSYIKHVPKHRGTTYSRKQWID